MTTKEMNLGIINNTYDENASIEENLQKLRALGIEMSERQYFRYLEIVNKIRNGGAEPIKYTDSEISDKLDVFMTIADNKKMLQDEFGIRVSEARICPILRNKREKFMSSFDRPQSVMSSFDKSQN
jgi:uncharacterized lipoprotein YehR (DUF1307 family)